MAATLEERCSWEVICRDEAIGALKKENETSEVLKKEKEDAEASAAVLRTSAAEAERARDLALQRAEKAEDFADRLRKELDAERTSAAEL